MSRRLPARLGDALCRIAGVDPGSPGHRLEREARLRLSREASLVLLCGHYKDVDQRVADLVGRMTLEEKVAEITGGQHTDRGLLDTTGQLHFTTAEDLFKEREKSRLLASQIELETMKMTEYLDECFQA